MSAICEFIHCAANVRTEPVFHSLRVTAEVCFVNQLTCAMLLRERGQGKNADEGSRWKQFVDGHPHQLSGSIDDRSVTPYYYVSIILL